MQLEAAKREEIIKRQDEAIRSLEVDSLISFLVEFFFVFKVMCWSHLIR